MMDLWLGRSMRERILILCAVALVAALSLNIFMVRPLRAAKAEAEISLAVAARTLDAVSAARPAEQVSLQGQAGPAVAGEDLRARLVDLASQAGLSVSRLQAGDKGRIVIQFDRAAAPALFAWLESAERQLGATPAQASVFAETSGTVRASFEFRGGVS